jgi:excisionase family DNA binding protein
LSKSRDDYLTLAEVCEMLKIARTTFYDWRRKRCAPPSFKLPNGEVRIRRSDFDAWVEDREEVLV